MEVSNNSSGSRFISIHNTTDKVKVDDQGITNNHQHRYIEINSVDEGDVVSVRRSSEDRSEEDSSEVDGESELTDHDAIRPNLNASGTITISEDSETDGED